MQFYLKPGQFFKVKRFFHSYIENDIRSSRIQEGDLLLIISVPDGVDGIIKFLSNGILFTRYAEKRQFFTWVIEVL